MLQPVLLLILSGVQIRAQLQVIVGSVLVRHQGGSVRLVGGLGESVAAGRGLWTVMQLGVE